VSVGNVISATYYKDASNDRLTFIDGGAVNIFTLKNGGNVGIGTTNPSAKLQVKAAISTVYANVAPSVSNSIIAISNTQTSETTNDQAQIQFGVNGGTYNRVGSIGLIAESASNRKAALVFATDDAGTRAEKMRITGDGKVGIGTTDPGNHKLKVAGETHSTHFITGYDWTAKTGGLHIGNDGLTTGAISFYNGSNSSANIYRNSDILYVGARAGVNTAGLAIKVDGNVGIGTASPNKKLEVVDSAAAQILAKGWGPDSAGNDGGAIQLGEEASFHGLFSYDNATSILYIDNAYNSSSGDIRFRTKTSGTAITAVTIEGDGDVGIGTDSPAAKLHIKDASSPPEIRLEDAAGGTQTAKIVFDQASQNSLVLSTQYQSSSDGNLIQFAPADNVAMTIRGGTGTSDGFVGIGTASPSEKLDVVGNVKHQGLTMTSGTDVDQLKTFTQTLTITTNWQDTGIDGSDLTTGTYIVQLLGDDDEVGGTYNVYYSGMMSWYSIGTNDADFTSEIALHRAGHADVGRTLYLRTSTNNSGGNNLELQIAGNYNATGSDSYVFKFRRMI